MINCDILYLENLGGAFMAEVFKLPGSSYEEITKIIRAYSNVKNGQALSLADLAQMSGMDKTIISRNNGFLLQLKLITEGNKKAPTEICTTLGRAYNLGMTEQVSKIWFEIVKNDEFLNRMISTIQIKMEMPKQEFVNHIVFSSSNNNSNNARAGASAIIEILKLTQMIEENDGMITARKSSVVENSIISEKTQSVVEAKNQDNKKADSNIKEMNLPETGYYIQSYTCESGKFAKIIIPEDATEDDLFAFEDMLKIVLKRKFKLNSDL